LNEGSEYLFVSLLRVAGIETGVANIAVGSVGLFRYSFDGRLTDEVVDATIECKGNVPTVT
jgi:hypothetical protein